MKTTEELKLIDIDKLIPYTNNARTQTEAQSQASSLGYQVVRQDKGVKGIKMDVNPIW